MSPNGNGIPGDINKNGVEIQINQLKVCFAMINRVRVLG